MKNETDVIRAFLAREQVAGPRLQCELRPAKQSTDPRSGEPVDGLPTAVLWNDDQPLAALIGDVVLLNRTARGADQRRLVAEEARRRGREVQEVREPDLWRLTS